MSVMTAVAKPAVDPKYFKDRSPRITPAEA
jgi:hypothetical protein